MKFYSATLLPVISKATLKNLTHITKETLECPMAQVKKFTSAEMWNIQKHRRTFATRRFI